MTTGNTISLASLERMQISQVIEDYPETMVVFHNYGLDMCCGGSHPVAEAARLHEIPCDELTTALLDSINRERR
jgi:iron-sulfur cluster repair protein YtfE (RIC family)